MSHTVKIVDDQVKVSVIVKISVGRTIWIGWFGESPGTCNILKLKVAFIVEKKVGLEYTA